MAHAPQSLILANLNVHGVEKLMSQGPLSEDKLVKLLDTGKFDVSFFPVDELFETQFRADFIQLTDHISPIGLSTENIGGLLQAQEPGGAEGVVGIATTPPNNIVLILDENNDEILDDQGNRVFGRLTDGVDFNLTGTITLTNASNALTGVGTLFTLELEPGDIVRLSTEDPPVWGEIDTITDDFNATLVNNFSGVGGTDPGIRRRWTIDYLSQQPPGPVETPYLGFTGQTIRLFPLKVYTLLDLPVFPGHVSLPSDQLAGTIPDGSTTLKGKVQFATDGEVAALKAVQANDSRLLTAKNYVVEFSKENNASDQYLKFNGIYSNISGARIFDNANITAISAQSSDSALGFDIQIRRNGLVAALVTLAVPAGTPTGASTNGLSVAVLQDDVLEAYIDGDGDDVQVLLEITMS